MLASWPWAQAQPLIRPLAALKAFGQHDLRFITVLFDGRVYAANDLPATYTAQMLLLQLPISAIVLIAVSPLAFVAWCGDDDRASNRRLARLLISVAWCFPLLYAAWRHAPAARVTS